MNTVVNLKNKDVFQSDPSTYRLVNQGVAKLENRLIILLDLDALLGDHAENQVRAAA